MVNKKLKGLLIFVLTIAIIIPTQISFVHSSVGPIRINSTTASVSKPQVIAGDTVNLYFGDPNIKWAGQNFYLILSQDLSTTVSSDDHIYSAMFSVASLKTSTISYYSNNEGTWVVGSNWVNGTFASNMPAGEYSVKAFDFSGPNTETDTATVAVTDTFIIVNTSADQYTFQITPNKGPGGVPVQFSGSGYPPNTVLDITYYDPKYSAYRTWTRETTDATGSFSFIAAIPDLGKSNRQGDTPETFNTIQFQIQYQGFPPKIATYNQYARGIKNIGNQVAYGLYGNGSDLISTFKVKPGDTFTITGKYFHPGDIVYVLLDSETIMGTVTRSQWNEAIPIGHSIISSTGGVDVEVTIPKTINGGEHYVAIEDSQSTVILKILVTEGSFQIFPDAGPGGTIIEFTGSGYPPLSTVDITYQDGLYGSWKYWTTVKADATGNINLTHEIPDLKKSGYAGDYSTLYSQLMFRTEINGRIFAYASYTQYARGLKQVGNNIAANLYGSSTNFGNYGMKVKPGDSITIVGRYFHPGVIYVRWDGQAVVNTVTPDQWSNAELLKTTIADAQGSFDITITIPQTSNGRHWVSIEDSETTFTIQIPVEATTTTTTSPGGGSSSSPKPQPESPPEQTPSKPAPIINLQGKSVPISTGYRVEISGTCSNNNMGLANKAIQLYSSKNGGKNWEPLSIVNTDNEGQFNAVWVSLTSGTFLIKAECGETGEYASATATVNLAIEPVLSNHNGETVFTVTSNSTISQLAFNSKTSEFSFTASGATGTKGYVNVNIPKTLIKDLTNLMVYLDGKELAYHTTEEADTWIITIIYTHSTHIITMNLASSTQNQNTIVTMIAGIIGIVAIIAVATIVTTKKKKRSS